MCVLTKLFLYADIVQDHAYYLYDVSLEPHRKVWTAQHDKEIIPSDYLTMFVSNRHSTYLRVYEKTKQPNTCKDTMPLKFVPTNTLLKEVDTKSTVVSHKIINSAMKPLYSYDHFGKVFDLIPISKEVTDELARNEFFKRILQTVIGNTYDFGKINLPEGKRKPYSIYGRARNDLCLVHKHNYFKAAVIMIQDDECSERQDEDEEEDQNFDVRGRTLEFKVNQNEYMFFPTQQTSKEMLKTAGDLLARALLMGKQVDSVIIYGLAASHYSRHAKLMKLYINFNNNKASIDCSATAIDMAHGFNWLLNSICIE